ncbi:MAG TPA: helix-turn-helix domain-containing protein [Solirubrobacteraceae bacterium]|nr:helix-turn-helix domain-containing protein [Solirubrobacteraceae bacterium]
MNASALPLPPLDRLPSGRHRLSREAVESSQRGRLLFAIAQVVAEKGYAAATVADIVDRASVSRTTFYEQFPDKEACFIAAFDFAVEYVLGQMRQAWEELGEGDNDGERDWRERVRSDLTTYLRVLASEPAFARALHVEALAAGPAALERRAVMLSLFADRTRRVHELARAAEPSLPELQQAAFAVHTGGVDELIREWIRTRGAGSLPELAEPALAATLAIFGALPPPASR